MIYRIHSRVFPTAKHADGRNGVIVSWGGSTTQSNLVAGFADMLIGGQHRFTRGLVRNKVIPA